MTDRKSLDGLLRFLDYLKDKGLLKANTATSRKATANKVLSVLPADELQDVTTLDLDDVMDRFANLEGLNYSPDSLTTYKSRLKSTLDDFQSYLDNPSGFRPQVQSRSRVKRPERSENNTKNSDQTEVRKPSDSDQNFADTLTLPIPLRENLIVKIQGLPFDLTVAEAKKVAAVVQAMAIQE